MRRGLVWIAPLTAGGATAPVTDPAPFLGGDLGPISGGPPLYRPQG